MSQVYTNVWSKPSYQFDQYETTASSVIDDVDNKESTIMYAKFGLLTQIS